MNKQLSKIKRKAANIVLRKIDEKILFESLKATCNKTLESPSDLFIDDILACIDGEKSLCKILSFIELKHGKVYTSDEIIKLIEYFQHLEEYSYIGINPKYLLTKDGIKKGLENIGIKKGDKIIVHSSLSSLGTVVGGAETVCKACMELLSEDGLLMMPSFNHYEAVGEDGKGFFDPLLTPSTNGAVPDFFWRMKGVFRSLDPSHAFATWGKNAFDYVKNHHHVSTMGKGSPLELLERDGGKIVLIDCPAANTFMHVVEMTNNSPCLGKRTEEYNVKLLSGKLVKHRTWGWRDGECPVVKSLKDFKLMREKNLINETTIGGAHVMCFSASDFRIIYEQLLQGKIIGVSGCSTCPIRPRKVAMTVPSDYKINKGSKIYENCNSQ